MENLSFRSSLLACLSLLLAGHVLADSDINLQNAVGSVFLSTGREYINTAARVSDEHAVDSVRQAYERYVKELPDSARAEFFFVVVMNLQLDGSFQYELHEMIAQECGFPFYQRATAFLAAAEELRGELRVRRIEAVVRFLEKETPEMIKPRSDESKLCRTEFTSSFGPN